MAESYKKVFPGNAVNHLNAYGQPGADFTAAGRPTGSPLDRRQQALMFCPGWLAVRKVGYAKITEAATAAFDIIVPSPDTRSDDKPRADIVGLHIPQTALCYRAGFRVLPTSEQPGYYSQGARQATTTSGASVRPSAAKDWPMLWATARVDVVDASEMSSSKAVNAADRAQTSAAITVATAVWLPPAGKGRAGGADVGYGVYDPYDLGEFDQKGTVATKYGSRAQYLEAVAACRARGGRVIAVGTTSVRSLEAVAQLHGGTLQPHAGPVNLVPSVNSPVASMSNAPWSRRNAA